MKGLESFENSLGFRCLRIHYSADPEKDPTNPDPIKAERGRAWLDAQRRTWPDPNDWAREFEINFYVGRGTRVFPQFTMAIHTQELRYTPRKILYRGWDFGWHCPVCLIAQIDQRDRLLLLREIVGHQETTKDFAQKVVEACGREYPNHAAGFEDFCDPAGQQIQHIESERSERRDIEVLNGLGIFPRFEYGWSRKDGRSLIHQILAIRSDQTPGLYVDQGKCSLLSEGFLGQYVYPEQKSDNKLSDEPNDKDHPWGDVMAALRYLAAGLHTKLGLSRHRPSADSVVSGMTGMPSFHGYGTPNRRVE